MRPLNVAHGAILLFACMSAGCYRVTVTSGRAEAPGGPATNGSTRGGMINGIVEENPLHMGMVCKSGWSSVYVETGFINGFINGFRGLIYHTQNITLRCAPDAPLPATTAITPPVGGV